jgi:hypothetical protein
MSHVTGVLADASRLARHVVRGNEVNPVAV